MERRNFDVIISHGPNCVDGAMTAWCLWRKSPNLYKKSLSLEGGFYSFNPKKNKNKKYIHLIQIKLKEL